MEKEYSIYLGSKKVGVTRLEKADVPMEVVFGRIDFNGIESLYTLIKEYCLENKIVINMDDPKFEFIDIQVMSDLKVFRKDGIEIKGISGTSITGMKDEGYEISILGIVYPFYEEEFPHHVKAYKEIYKE